MRKKFFMLRVGTHLYFSPSLRLLTKAMTSVASDTHGPIGNSVYKKLVEAFQPIHLSVLNESYMHNVPKGSETHFKVVVVSDLFEGKSLLQRHRLVNEVLQDELANGVHALSIQSKTPSQWEKSQVVHQSPSCLGGRAKDPNFQNGNSK